MPFGGETYEPEHDENRLRRQLAAVKNIMLDGQWHTLAELHTRIGAGSEAGISARIRDLRKDKFGGFVVERRRVAPAVRGLHEYRLLTVSVPHEEDQQQQPQDDGDVRRLVEEHGA
jgi:hypothetical protein